MTEMAIRSPTPKPILRAIKKSFFINLASSNFTLNSSLVKSRDS